MRSANQVGVNADETGFKEKGKNMWVWIAVSCRVAVFMIRRGRNKQSAKALLRKNFRGILCSDRYKDGHIDHGLLKKRTKPTRIFQGL